MEATPFSNRWILLILFLAIAAPAWAGEPTDQVKQTTDKILAVLSDPGMRSPSKSEEKKKRISQIADDRFDWEEIARRTLARHWAQRTPDERKEYAGLFRELMERTYLDKVDLYSGETVRYEGDKIEGDYAVVNVRVLTSTQKEIRMEYRVTKKGNQWLIYDVVVEGVSLVGNYRSQINSILVKSSFQELVKTLKAKLAQ